MAKKKKTEEELEKLMKLTRLMKQNNIKVAPKGPPRGANKWRSSEPKFAEKKEKRADLVQAGGMDVDPSVKDQYEQWRKDKEAEQRDRRDMLARKARVRREMEKENPLIPPDISSI